MAGLRAPRAGSAREQQIKVENSFDPEEALKCLAWIREVTGEPIPLESVLDNKHKVSEFFYKTLKDGLLLVKLVNAIVPDDLQINTRTQTFKKSNNDAFESAKERARIELFTQKIQEYGVAENMGFQTDNLYEKTNLAQVVAAIRNLGIEAESRPSYSGHRIWPKRAEANRRNFSEEQLRASEGVINLQMGTNKGANQSGMNFGKKRMITKEIELFVYKCQEFGVAENNTFQTDSLYERTNLSQVCAAIRALGIEAESRPSYTGTRMWPKKSETNRRTFTEEQLRMGESVINLQMGTNKFATQSGMNFGKKRMITKD